MTRKTRTEHDTMGAVEVPDEKYWGAQTQRSFQNFRIGGIRMPVEIIHQLACIKKAAACANADCGVLPLEKRDLIVRVCDEIISGCLDDHFPLVVWQTGSGTQTNMNVNEVVANRAEMLRGGVPGQGRLLSPNDDVNMSQSTNDVFPSAMRMAAACMLLDHTLPALESLQRTFAAKADAFHDIIKIGRTHTQDATPLRLGDEFSGYAAQLACGVEALKHTLPHLMELPVGGTAVGTGLNTPDGYDRKCVEYIVRFTGKPFTPARNKFEAVSSHDAVVETSGALRQLAVSLMKIANDLRMSASGPRSGIGEILLPQNEPGSSIMPGKVNPTQCEAMTMVCAQVIGNDAAIAVSGMQGHWQLNVFMPVIAYNIIQSLGLLGDACASFETHCVSGIVANEKRISDNLNASLMLVTALSPHIGYHRAAEIARYAYDNGLLLREAALRLGYLTAEEFDEWVVPDKMVGR